MIPTNGDSLPLFPSRCFRLPRMMGTIKALANHLIESESKPFLPSQNPLSHQSNFQYDPIQSLEICVASKLEEGDFWVQFASFDDSFADYSDSTLAFLLEKYPQPHWSATMMSGSYSGFAFGCLSRGIRSSGQTAVEMYKGIHGSISIEV